jgi:VanZ family protein
MIGLRAVTAVRLMRAAAWIAVAAIAVLSVLPGEDRPHVLESSQMEHLEAYSATAAALAVGYAQVRARIAIGVGLSLLAGSFEILQVWIPGRDPKVSDWIVSSVGAWAGLAVVASVWWTWSMVRARSAGAPRRAS